MIHPSKWKKILIRKGFLSDFGIDKVSVEKLKLPDDGIKFIFTLPKPKATPDCFFTMIILEILYIRTRHWKFNCINGGGIICGQEDII